VTLEKLLSPSQFSGYPGVFIKISAVSPAILSSDCSVD
jgi:hypothetical protein